MAAYASPLLSAPAVYPGSFDYGYGGLATTAYTPAFTPAYVPQPAFVPTVSAIEVDRAVAVPTVQYSQSAPVAPGYPLNLREGDFYNPAANNVFDRLVGTQAGRGGVYNNPGAKKSGGLFSRKPKTAAATPVAAPAAVPVAPVAPVVPTGAPIVVPPSAYATQYGASPYGPSGPVAAYGPNGFPTAFPGGIGAPFTGAAGAPYTGAVPVGAAPVAPIAGGAYPQSMAVNKKGKPVKQKGGVRPLPTLAQAEALDVAATHLAPTAWVGPPVPSGPPLTSVTQYPPVALPAGPVIATGLPPTYTIY